MVRTCSSSASTTITMSIRCSLVSSVGCFASRYREPPRLLICCPSRSIYSLLRRQPVECELEGVLDSLPTRSRVLHSKIFPEGRKGCAHHLYTVVPAARHRYGKDTASRC